MCFCVPSSASGFGISAPLLHARIVQGPPCLPCAASCRPVSRHEKSFGQWLIHAHLRTHFGVAIVAEFFVTRIAISTHAKGLMH